MWMLTLSARIMTSDCCQIVHQTTFASCCHLIDVHFGNDRQENREHHRPREPSQCFAAQPIQAQLSIGSIAYIKFGAEGFKEFKSHLYYLALCCDHKSQILKHLTFFETCGSTVRVRHSISTRFQYLPGSAPCFLCISTNLLDGNVRASCHCVVSTSRML